MKYLKFLSMLTLILTLSFVFVLSSCSKKKEEPVEDKKTIILDNNGVGEKPEDIEYTSLSSVTLPTLASEGYEFLGWYSYVGDDDTLVLVTNENKDELLAAYDQVELIAYWEKTFAHQNIVLELEGAKSIKLEGKEDETVSAKVEFEYYLNNTKATSLSNVVCDFILKSVEFTDDEGKETKLSDIVSLFAREGILYVDVNSALGLDLTSLELEAEEGQYHGALNLLMIQATLEQIVSELLKQFMPEGSDTDNPLSSITSLEDLLALIPQEYLPSENLVAAANKLFADEDFEAVVSTLTDLLVIEFTDNAELAISITSESINKVLDEVVEILTAEDNKLIEEVLEVLLEITYQYQDLLAMVTGYIGLDVNMSLSKAQYEKALARLAEQASDYKDDLEKLAVKAKAAISSIKLRLTLLIGQNEANDVVYKLQAAFTTIEEYYNNVSDEFEDVEVDYSLELAVTITELGASSTHIVISTLYKDLTAKLLEELTSALSGLIPA